MPPEIFTQDIFLICFTLDSMSRCKMIENSFIRIYDFCRWVISSTHHIVSSGTLCRAAQETQVSSSLPSCQHQEEKISWELEMLAENTLKIASVLQVSPPN